MVSSTFQNLIEPLLMSPTSDLLVTAVLVTTVVLVDDTPLQFDFSWPADHVERRVVHISCGAAVCLLMPMSPFAADTPWLWWMLLLVLGAAADTIYMLSPLACSEHFEGQHVQSSGCTVNSILLTHAAGWLHSYTIFLNKNRRSQYGRQ